MKIKKTMWQRIAIYMQVGICIAISVICLLVYRIWGTAYYGKLVSSSEKRFAIDMFDLFLFLDS